MASGTATLDFGATPTDTASVTVGGQAGLTAASFIEAFFMREAGGTNDADAHEQAAFFLKLVCEFVSATSFTIIAQSLVGLATGTFTVRWVTL